VRFKLLSADDSSVALPDDATEGELAVQTDVMFSGYFKDAEKTSEAFTADRFYKTGDLVEIWSDGEGAKHVRVKGRSKSSIKLSSGLWVCPEPLEDLYRTCGGVEFVWLHGDNDQLIAVVDVAQAVDQDQAASLAADLLGRFERVAQGAQRRPHEFVAGVVVAQEHFSRQAGTLNGTLKLHRRNLLQAYQQEIALKHLQLAEDAARKATEGLQPEQSFKAQRSSIDAMRIASLYFKLGVPVHRTISLLLGDDQAVSRTMQALDAMSPRTKAGSTGHRAVALIEPTDDVSLPEDIDIDRLRGNTQRAECVLITGCTGFVGPFVLAELLRKNDVDVVCLVRANDAVSGRKRVHAALMRAGRFGCMREGGSAERLQVQCGALGKERLGMSEGEFESLGKRVTKVIHLGAVVDLKGSYFLHRDANVLGTTDVIRLASISSARLLFVSTTDVLPSGSAGESSSVSEEEESTALPAADSVQRQESGYSASKAVGEVLVAEALRRGLPGCIARLGMVGADSETGVCNPRDFLSRLFIGFSHTRCFPETTAEHTLTHALPVDVAARALVELAQSSDADRLAVNVVSAAPLLSMSALRERLLAFQPVASEANPYGELPLVPFPHWIRSVREDAAVSAWPVMSWAADRQAFPVYNSRKCLLGRLAGFMRSETLEGLLAGMDEQCLHRQLAFLHFA
jgi:thioester reductase-like protein